MYTSPRETKFRYGLTARMRKYGDLSEGIIMGHSDGVRLID
jgi:hypothetical protein